MCAANRSTSSVNRPASEAVAEDTVAEPADRTERHAVGPDQAYAGAGTDRQQLECPVETREHPSPPGRVPREGLHEAGFRGARQSQLQRRLVDAGPSDVSMLAPSSCAGPPRLRGVLPGEHDAGILDRHTRLLRWPTRWLSNRLVVPWRFPPNARGRSIRPAEVHGLVEQVEPAFEVRCGECILTVNGQQVRAERAARDAGVVEHGAAPERSELR